MKKIMFKINEAANNWNKTKNTKYKEEWYKLVKEFRHHASGDTQNEQPHDQLRLF